MLVEGKWYKVKTVDELKAMPNVSIHNNHGKFQYATLNGGCTEYTISSSMVEHRERIQCFGIYDKYFKTFDYKGYYWQEWMLKPCDLMETE